MALQKIPNSMLESGGAVSVPAGTIVPYGGSSAPTGYLLCDGSAVSRTTYADLFSAIGTAFGAGNGTTTFNIPNTSGLVLRGTGNQALSGRTKTGPSVGATQEDQIQGHVHYSFSSQVDGSALSNARVPVYSTTGGTADTYTIEGDTGGIADANTGPGSTPITDGSNGTPRTGDETRVSALGVNYIIKF